MEDRVGDMKWGLGLPRRSIGDFSLRVCGLGLDICLTSLALTVVSVRVPIVLEDRCWTVEELI